MPRDRAASPNVQALLRTWLRRSAPLVAAAVFLAAAWQVQRWLRAQSLADIAAAFRAMPLSAILGAVGLTCASYTWATCYDLAGVHSIARRRPWPRVMRTAFVANALANNLGNALLTGSAVRYWNYSKWGLTAADVARVMLFSTVSFWMGYLLVAGTVLVHTPSALPGPWAHLAGLSPAALGIACLSVLACYAAAVLVNALRGPAQRAYHAWAVRLPSPAMAGLQVVLGAGDLLLMAGVFSTLLSAHGVSFAGSVLVVLLAMVASWLSLVPGGLGVFESVVILLLGARVPAAALAADLVAYRLVYFVLPLAVAMALSTARPALRRLRALLSFRHP